MYPLRLNICKNLSLHLQTQFYVHFSRSIPDVPQRNFGGEFISTSRDRAVRLNPVKKLVFSSTDVRTGGGNCNCEVDDVRIFEVTLSPSEIRELVDYGWITDEAAPIY